MLTPRTLSRVAALTAGGALALAAAWVSASPAVAASSSLPTGPYTAALTPYLSTVSGVGELAHQGSGWLASVQLKGLTPGHHYQYEASIVEHYVDGQGVSFATFPLCSFVASSAEGGCSASSINIENRQALTLQSSGFVYSPEAHTSVANGDFSYRAALSPYDGLSRGGSASVGYNAETTSWWGSVSVSGLTPDATYTWAIDVVEAYDSSGNPVSFQRVVLCQFTPATAGQAGCSVHGISIAGLSDLPADSSTDVASTVTSVAIGMLY
jgi:hypothetical protein